MKNHILAITPNPTLDFSGRAEVIVPDEKTYVTKLSTQPGGNGINVARILTRFGARVTATGFIGGSIGREIETKLRDEGVRTKFVRIAAQSRIGMTVLNQEDGRQTRFSFPGPPISARHRGELLAQVRDDRDLSMLILGGSFPPNFTVADARRLMALARKRDVPVIVDCPGKLTEALIGAGPMLIKPNLEEFHAMLGRRPTKKAAIARAARGMLDRVGMICVSSVAGGALLITPEGSYFGKLPAFKVRTTVGAGDSMVAAMALETAAGRGSPENLLRFALAAAGATLSSKYSDLAPPRRVKELISQIQIERVGSRAR